MGFRLREVSLYADSDRPISRVADHLALAWAHDTGADLAKTNVDGGAIAIGHPLGASGARIMTTLVNALEQRGGRYGLQTMREGGGMANATIIERLG
jgi:acetyl-CoA acyltransferase